MRGEDGGSSWTFWFAAFGTMPEDDPSLGTGTGGG